MLIPMCLFRTTVVMRCSIVLLASCAIALQSFAQRPASPEQIDKALELLRRTPGVAPSPAPQPGVGLKITSNTNAVPAVAAQSNVSTNHLAADAEDRARAMLRKIMIEQPATPQATVPSTSIAPSTPTPDTAPQAVQAPAAPAPSTAPAPGDPLERARNREAVRQKALSEARNIAEQQRTTERPTPQVAGDQQRKALADAERQRELQRIEMEVEKARRERELKNAPQVAQPAPVVPQAVPAPAAPAPTLAQPATPQPAISAPQPAPAVQPIRQAPPASPKFSGLEPDMEQRARDILNQVLANTQDAQLPKNLQTPAATTPTPAPATAVRVQPAQAAVAVPAETSKPQASAAPTPIPAAPLPAAELAGDKETQARELLNRTLASLPARPPENQKPTDREAKEQVKRELRDKADAEAKARREVQRIEEESRERAQAQARQRLDAEKAQTATATPQVEPAVARTEPVPVQRTVVTRSAPQKSGKSGRDSKTATEKAAFADDPKAPKEQRLADLLTAYQQDEINAEQYHSLRRKIIAE